jgi:ATP-binding cassette subfamily B protein/subfamily B ATP-binding cassette protein MsbA
MGARHVLDGKLTIGHLLVFLVYLTTLQAQVKVLAAVQTTWRSVSASLERVSEMLEGSAEVKEAADAASLPPVRGEIVFENVTFGYEPGRPVLRELSLRVSPGETVAIVGLSGCGKTTLVNLVPRLFDPSSGCVQVDGHDLRTVQLESLRRQVGVMLQEPFLFPLSVAENIAFGRPEAGREEVVAAARVASAHAFIERLPSGYDTVLGERGVTLSGGERQRLAIARALLKNAPILILDEPTSSLDAQTEMELLDALERLMVGRTTLLIAHRLLTVRRANRIVVLQDGVIREEGTHAELLEHEGLYAQWHDMQTKQPRTEPAST